MSYAASELLTRRSTMTLAPASLNREAGTVEVTLSTGAPVARAGFTERLAIGAENVAVADRVPLLDTHRQGSIRDILGRVTGIRHELGRIVATLHISNPDALAAIERGDIGGVSIGYRATAWADSKDPTTGARIRTATRWTLVEASLVPVPADSGATIRSHPMADESTITETAPTEAETITRARDIRALSVRANLPATWADAQIDGGATVLEARTAALDAILARPAPAIRTTTSGPADGDHMAHRAEAIAHRMAGTPLTDAARPYQHHRLIDHARDLLALRGESVTGMSPDGLLTRAMGGAHTTSDFPALLTSAGNRTLAAPYAAALSPVRALFRQSTAVDFRGKTRLSLSEMPALLKVAEGGEIKYGTRGESAESYKLETYARLFALSRQAIINDDLSAFADWTGAMASAAAETENMLRTELLTQGSGAGPIMGDTKRLFHADHGNLATVPAALSVESLGAARLALRTQKGLDGKTPAGTAPKYLLVGPALETEAEQLLSSTIAPIEAASANPFSGRLTLLVEPRLSGRSWYVFGDPASRPVFEQSHLSGAEGPQLASREGWDVLGVEYRCFIDTCMGAIDWRGAYRNAGA
jgi:hypothetical protein